MNTLEKDKEALSWLTCAWDDYADNFLFLLPVLLTQTALSAGAFYLIWRYHSLLAAAPYMLFVTTPIATGANLVYIKVARGGGGARFRDLFSAFPVYHRALAVSLWLGVITMGGALLLVVPGVMFFLAYGFSEYAVVDRRTGIKESFQLSAIITDGWKSRLLFVFTLLLLVNLMGPDIFVITGPLKSPSASLNLKPWVLTAAALKTLVFLPWLSLAMARAYNFMLRAPRPEPAEAGKVD